jgi:hypothetical protein
MNSRLVCFAKLGQHPPPQPASLGQGGGRFPPPPAPREGDSGGGCPRHVLGGRPKAKTPRCPPAVGGPRPARGRPSQIPEIHPPRSRVEAGAQPSPSRPAGGGSRGRAVGRRPSRPAASGILGGCRRTCAAACSLVLRKCRPNSTQRTLLPDPPPSQRQEGGSHPLPPCGRGIQGESGGPADQRPAWRPGGLGPPVKRRAMPWRCRGSRAPSGALGVPVGWEPRRDVTDPSARRV